jgi:drug/metabolite transporter (DMT)-like permease
MRTRTSLGTLLAGAGAFAYGVTVIVGRRLAEGGVPPGTALGFRFMVAAVVLAVLLRARGVAIVPERAELVRVALLGAIGYTTESTFFYLALQRGTAAAVSLLFYVYPAIVCVIEIVRGREKTERSTVAALAVAVAGTSVVVTTGARVSITPAGIAFALSSATVFSLYILVSREVLRRAEAMRAAAWVAAGASAGSFVRGAFAGELRNPSGHVVALALYGVFTAAAFALIFAALERIGAARTAVVMTLEAVTAVVLGAVLLGERLHVPQVAGGAAILVAAAMIGRQRAADTAAADLHE